MLSLIALAAAPASSEIRSWNTGKLAAVCNIRVGSDRKPPIENHESPSARIM